MMIMTHITYVVTEIGGDCYYSISKACLPNSDEDSIQAASVLRRMRNKLVTTQTNRSTYILAPIGDGR